MNRARPEAVCLERANQIVVLACAVGLKIARSMLDQQQTLLQIASKAN